MSEIYAFTKFCQSLSNQLVTGKDHHLLNVLTFQVHTYSYESGSFSSSSSSASSGYLSANKSKSSSPGSSRGVSPSHPVAGEAPQDLQRLIYDLLKEYPMGVWSKRLGAMFKKKYNREAPRDIDVLAISLPFVIKDE